MVRNAYGGKPGSQGGKAMLLSHTQRLEPPLYPLPTHHHWQLKNRERPKKGWSLLFGTVEKDPPREAISVPDMPSNREGPQSGELFECLAQMGQATEAPAKKAF